MYLLLYFFWLILNGRLTWEVALLGLAVVAAVGALAYVLFGYTPRREWRIVKKIPLFMLRFGRFMLANSITLTPGTITVRMDGDRLTVHCLKRSMLDTSPDSVFERWISRLEA